MNSGDHPTFDNKDAEVQYWRNLAEQYYEDVERIQKESDEFIGESQQLEKEYEATIDQNEKKIKELTLANQRMQNELDACRLKLDQANKETTNMENEISAMRAEKAKIAQHVRDLEQKNDDLERAQRIIEASFSGIRSECDSAIEKNAILELEVNDQEPLKVKLQRLLDEKKELQEELLAKQRCPDNERLMNGGYKSPSLDSNRLKENETQTTPLKHEFQTPITPASRVMALNLVSDLIRKVGDLERRIEKNKYEYNRDISTNDVRRGRHSTKNSSAASLHGLTK